MERLLRLGGHGIGGMGSQSPESSQNDTAEQVLTRTFAFLNFKMERKRSILRKNRPNKLDINRI